MFRNAGAFLAELSRLQELGKAEHRVVSVRSAEWRHRRTVRSSGILGNESLGTRRRLERVERWRLLDHLINPTAGVCLAGSVRACLVPLRPTEVAFAERASPGREAQRVHRVEPRAPRE